MIQMPHVMDGYGMTPNAIAQISAKVAMASCFLGNVSYLPPSEQTICLPRQNVQDPSTWTLPHLLQLKQEYNNLSVVQESYAVQDPPAPPSDTLLLTPLTSLYSVNTLNRELPQQGESRPVLPPTQRSLSRQIMKAWAPWTEVIASSQNSRMLEQLTLRTPLTIDATKEQDLDPRPCSNIEHPSVLAHEMMKIEPGEKPSRKLT